MKNKYSVRRILTILAVYLLNSILLSFRIIHQLLREKFGQVISHIIVMVICILTGYGIFLGRFLRLNSWSFLHAAHLFQKPAWVNAVFVLKFTFFYAFFVYMIYFVFCSFYPKTDMSWDSKGNPQSKSSLAYWVWVESGFLVYGISDCIMPLLR